MMQLQCDINVKANYPHILRVTCFLVYLLDKTKILTYRFIKLALLWGEAQLCFP